MGIVQDIGKRINEKGGSLLAIDYGNDEISEFSLLGIKDHKFVNFLETPGHTDLSVHVNFNNLRRAIKGKGNGKLFIIK
jgi:SAM-dependent MidA family methyltransferase